MALTWDDKVALVIDERMHVKKIKLLDTGCEITNESEEEALDAQLWICIAATLFCSR